MDMISYVLSAVIAYIIGNLSGAVIVSRTFKGDDIRRHGSGNAGTANMLRVYGKRAAITTFAIDAGKGVLAVSVGRLLGGDSGSYIGAVCVMLGHDWPILLGFKGGKGVATGVAALIAIDWRAGLIVLGAGVLIIILTKTFSLGALAMCLTYPFASIFLYWGNWGKIVTIFILCILIVYGHRGNIRRLFSGTEIKAKKTAQGKGR